MSPHRQFQSTLPVAGERCRRPPGQWVRRCCFNPRSPLPGSDARCRIRRPTATRCFNPRSPLPGSDAVRGGVALRLRRRFNPRSPLPGSDAMIRSVSTSFEASFNPRSPLPGSDARLANKYMLRDLLFQSTLPVAGERCSSSGSPGIQSGKGLRCANLWPKGAGRCYLRCPANVKRKAINALRGARTGRGKYGHFRFAQRHRMRGASKLVARKRPCSRTS